jgi:uncharacterized membrane protein (UPF0127 family)
MKTVSIHNLSNTNCQPVKAKYCSSFANKLRGLMFQKEVLPDEGILLVENSDSTLSSSIHMLFMNFDIGVVWVNKEGIVVDTVHAKRWHMVYKPSYPACLTLEIHPDRLKDFKPGDVLSHETL